MNKIANQKPLRLYLIRHGEVEGAEAGRLLGRTDAPLSERGREQSHQLAEFLSTERLTSLYSRTHESGNIALITHVGVCQVIIGDALGMLARNWLRLAQYYGCVNVVDWYDGNPTVKLLNWRKDLRELRNRSIRSALISG
jgi:broad specificity phosphatase PhoE